MSPSRFLARSADRVKAKRHDNNVGADETGDDGGFGLIEILVAIIIFAIVLVVVLRASIVTMSTTAAQKERAVATSLMTETISQATVLGYSALSLGLSSNDVSGDTHLSSCGGIPASCTYTSPSGRTYIVPDDSTRAAGSPAEPPLFPHVNKVTLGTTYKITTYPTAEYASSSTSYPGQIKLIIIITWPSPTGGTATVSGSAVFNS